MEGSYLMDLVTLLKTLEGVSLMPYLDTEGYPTIGYGNRFYHDGREVSMDDQAITKEYAESLLIDYIIKSVAPVFKKIPFPLTENQKAGLGALIYNIGETSFLKSKCYRAILQKDWPTVFKEWDWGLRQGLTRRRVIELYWFFRDL